MIKKDSDEESVKFYATEYMNGNRRYDFAMIDFLLDDGDTATCPAKILGFVRYNITSGIPTPHISGNDRLNIFYHLQYEPEIVSDHQHSCIHEIHHASLMYKSA